MASHSALHGSQSPSRRSKYQNIFVVCMNFKVLIEGLYFRPVYFNPFKAIYGFPLTSTLPARFPWRCSATCITCPCNSTLTARLAKSFESWTVEPTVLSSSCRKSCFRFSQLCSILESPSFSLHSHLPSPLD